jgi:hypothetical protein
MSNRNVALNSSVLRLSLVKMRGIFNVLDHLHLGFSKLRGVGVAGSDAGAKKTISSSEPVAPAPRLILFPNGNGLSRRPLDGPDTGWKPVRRYSSAILAVVISSSSLVMLA